VKSDRIVIIGAGIAGLCAAVLARRCGYEVEVLEQHDIPGGLATSWRRGEYTFETCLHWLLGSSSGSQLHDYWKHVFDIDRLHFVYPDEFVRLETEHGKRLCIYTDVDRLEKELLCQASEDAQEIYRLTAGIRRLSGVRLPDPTLPWPRNWLQYLPMLPYLPALQRWSGLSSEDYGRRFHHELLHRFFGGDDGAELSVVAILFSLAWMGRREAGYPIGGSRAVIQPIVDELERLGGRLRLSSRVERVLVGDDIAVGVQLVGGETIPAERVISAGDGYTAIYKLLGGRYTDERIGGIYSALRTFPSYLQVSLGIGRDLSDKPGYLTQVLDAPLGLDPGTQLSQISFRIFHFDPTFAPPGKVAVTCFLPTREFAYWEKLRTDEHQTYAEEKQRIADAVIATLDRAIPGVREAIEEVDVATPASVIRYTGNWQGSMEGWLLTPGMRFSPLPNTLPGLERFIMVGHWVMPGGGFPAGLMTSRAAVHAICREDGVHFPY
jgi:phytoene dehydrogenase-like protein